MKPLAALLTTLLTAGAVAAELTADFAPLVAQPRPGSPEWVELKLSTRTGAVRSGVLEIEARSSGAPLYRYRTHELAITGSQRFRFLLPPNPAYVADRAWRLRFIDGERAEPLGDFSAPPSLNRGRALVLGIVRGTGESASTSRWHALRLERFAPAPQNPLDAPSFFTAPVFLDADDLPADPLGYCAFDAVLLEGGALAQLREKPRTALARWVHAGGSLAVFAPRGLHEPHIAFLNELGAPDPRWEPVALPLRGVKLARADLGRLLLAAELPPETLPPEWRQASGALWKLRSRPLARLATAEQWDASDIDSRHVNRADFNSSAALANSLTTSLLPNDLRTLPLGALVAILGGFLLAIGPLDWLALGALRKRRLTWIAFPCAALGCTALTVALARGFLGDTTRTGQLVITDLGVDGRVVRETRFQLTLPAREGELSIAIESALSAALQTGTDREPPALRFAGQFPARYQLARPGRQWAPAITRTTSLEPREDESGIRWSSFGGASFDAPSRTAYFDRLRAGQPFTFDLYWKGEQRLSEQGPLANNEREQLTITPARGLFALLARGAPSGSALAEDCPVREVDAPDESLVVATRRDGSTIHLWRHLFLH